MFDRLPAAAALLALASLPACVGAIPSTPPNDAPEPEGPARDSRPAPEVPPPNASPGRCATLNVGPAPLRRLTRPEYDRTLKDLLGKAGEDSKRELGADEHVGAFFSNISGPADEVSISRYRDAAEKAGAGGAELWRAAGCTAGNLACANKLIGELGQRAFRRPLRPDELGRYVQLFTEALPDRKPEEAMGLVVKTMLQSPHFLYRVEEAAPGTRRLTAHGLATRLSYFLWGTMPDAELMRAADDRSLEDPRVVARQTARLLASPRAQVVVNDFFTHWLGLDELEHLNLDPKLFPQLTAALKAGMRQETSDFVTHVFASAGAQLETLLTGRFTILNEAVAPLYGLSSSGRVDLDARRAGLLTQPAVLAANHGTVLRGKLVRTRVLCHDIPPPPPNVDTTLPPPQPNQSPRARLEAHGRGECRACHQMIDPPGFAFDNFDELGRWRDTYGGFPVDARGELSLGGKSVTFDGAVALINQLAASDEVKTCVARQWVRSALGRFETAADSCLVEDATTAFRDARWDLRALVSAIATSPSFAQLPREEASR